MNKLFAQSLGLIAQVYLEEKHMGTKGNAFLITQCKEILEDASAHGLVYWVGDMPMVHVKKMASEKNV